MKIKEYPELKYPCCEYDTDILSSCDVVPNLEENDTIGDSLNHLTNSALGLNLNYLDLSVIKDFREYFINAIHYRARSSFVYNELIFDYNYLLHKKGINACAKVTPDGLFVDMEDYQRWQNKYFKHPIKSYKEGEDD